TSTTWEVVPSVARELNFSFLVRDNHIGGGSSARDDMKVQVVDAEAFIVTSQNAEETFSSGQTISVAWNKGTTDLAPIDCENVNIKLSIDGGVTFPIFLKTNTPNDGAEDIIVPDNATANARILVEAVDNIFYNVNTSKLSIVSSTPTFLIIDETGEQSVCNTGDESISYTLNFDFINGFTETATLSATGYPVGSSVTFNPTTINSDGNVLVTVSNLEDKEAKNYEITIVGTSATVTQRVSLVLKLQSSIFDVLSLSSPTNGATNISIKEVLSWVEDENAASYDVEIALDSGFQTIVSSVNVLENSFQVDGLVSETVYFWRVKPKNDCGEGSFSDVFSFTTEIPLYCPSTFTDESGGGEHITNVTFSGINNTSGNDTSDGYEDFRSINTNLLRGQTKQISVTLDTDGFQDHCFVFIDWNQDFTFDKETERYDLGTVTADIGTVTFNISVPVSAKFGETRMRVIIEYADPTNGYGDGACDVDHFTEWGETEDYSVTVVELVNNPDNFSVLTTSESCVDENDGVINAVMDQSEYTYQVTVSGPSINITENLPGTSYTRQGLAPGDYEVCFFVVESNYTQCFEVNIEASEQIALKVASKNQSNTYSFNIDSGTAPYKVYLNEKLLSVSDTKEFEIEIFGSGKLEVKTAKDCEGFYKTSIGEILLKQNPISDSIDLLLPIGISEPNINALIFDLNGKMIYSQSIKREENTLSIPFKDYALGIYILKLSIENSKPIKIIKQ
ncbi:MAG: T9SS type A sorting domain-containing protein, partial [Polaribacter sp.]|nr:T9SS type A sorting domain-containing protein [Polaribacter sp.]